MKKNIYMAMPQPAGLMPPGVFVAGQAIPNDPQNEQWREYLAFCEAGGQAIAYDPALEWIDQAWRTNDVRARELFAASRLEAVSRFNAFITMQRDLAAGNPSAGEMQSRAAKRVVAEAVLGGTASEVQLLNLAIEAELRGMGETTEALARKIVLRAQALDTVNAKLDGLKRAAENALLAASTPAELSERVSSFQAQVAAVAAAGDQG